MGYLRYFDYVQRAQDPNIQQWIAKNMTILYTAERTAQQQITSRLSQKFDLSQEFTNTTLFNESAKYNAGGLVELNYTAYSVTAVYVAGNYISYTDGNVYKCILLTTAGILPTNTTYFKLIGAQFDLYYITPPYQAFYVQNLYNVGERVMYKNKIYQCLTASAIITQEDRIQAISTYNVALPNVFPDNPVDGPKQWGVGVSYIVTGYIPNDTTAPIYSPTNPYTIGQTVTYNGMRWKCLTANTGITPGFDIISWQSETWVNGDNRDNELVMYYVDIVVYNIMQRIAPMAIPKLRSDNYNIAMAWLKDAAHGIVSPNIPLYQNNKGSRIRGGSNVKMNNTI